MQIAPINENENELNKIDIDQYSCTECSSNIEIISIDELSNAISFKCPLHGNKIISIIDYLKNMKKNIYLYSECIYCKKLQNNFINKEIFYFCENCKITLCNKCLIKHDKKW